MPATIPPERSDVRAIERRAESLLMAAAMLLGLERQTAAAYAAEAVAMLIKFRDRRSST